MTQDQSAPFAHLDALKSADAGTVFAELIRAGLRALIEAESTARSRAAHPTAPTTENAQATILMARRYAG